MDGWTEKENVAHTQIIEHNSSLIRKGILILLQHELIIRAFH
jgi:hypothetical protein